MSAKATPTAVIVQQAFMAYYNVLWENREIIAESFPAERLKADMEKHQMWLTTFQNELAAQSSAGNADFDLA